MTLLEQHFTPDEILLLDAITATQTTAEMTGRDLVVGNPYSRGMWTWVNEELKEGDDASRERLLAVAAKYDGLDKDRTLHGILIARVLQR